MLHLDHNRTSALSPHTTPTLIPSDTSQSDQHPLLSWSAPAVAPTPSADDEPFKFDQNKDQSLPDKLATPPSQPDAPPPTQAVTEADPPPTVSVANVDEPKPPEPAPSSPVDATSPAIESTSSLTPPPDSTSPAFPPVTLPIEETSTQANLEQPDVETKTKAEGDLEEVDKASRASTPLSELSSAPDVDDPPAPDAGKKEGENEKQAVANPDANEGSGSKAAGESKPEPAKVTEETKYTNGHSDPSPAKSQAAPGNVAAAHRGSHDSQVTTFKHENTSDSEAHHLATPEPPTNAAARPSARLDPRVVTILELNAHLLKASIELQQRGLPLNDPIFQQYGHRLQTNLAWLAATADATRKVNHSSMTFPIMQAPPTIEFAAMERINHLYSELPILFQKDIMRRQSLMGGGNVPQIPSASNGHMKRDRTEDPPGDISNKRRDTGDSKMSTPGPGTPGHHSPSNSMGNIMGHPGTPPHSATLPNVSSVSMGSPSMPPPMLTGVLPSDTQSISAARSRMRSGMPDGNRLMSHPGSSGQPGSSMQHAAGPSSIPNNQAQMGAGVNSMSSSVMQSMQILQDPTHPATRYLSAQIPGFSNFPVAAQLQQLQKMQQLMQQRKGQGAQQHHMGGQVSGFAQGQNGQMNVPNSNPTRIPSQQQPMSPHGSFPFANQQGMDPRTANAMNAGNMSLDPQRRQQLQLMQQQQSIMRNNQIYAQQQQRLSQGASPHIGSPMLGGTPDGNNFPALRSNASVPGIARSTRTPSDHAPSPLTPQLSGRPEDMQRAMMQQGQRNMLQNQAMSQLGMGGMNQSWQQGQQMGNSMPHAQASYGMTPPGSAGYGSMSGGAPSPAGGQQWAQAGAGQFSFNGASPPGQDGNTPGSRQTSATPAPHQQMAQNSPMGGDQAGLNDFDLFSWAQ